MRAIALCLSVAAALAELETIKLAGGLEMPANGLGTCCRKTARGQPIIDATKAYLQLGGRLIDTAMAYRNHEEIGEALRASGVKREDVWITSKLASGTVNSYAKGISAIDNILQEIGASYLDLVLIHSPKMGRDKAVAVWKSLIDAKKNGSLTLLVLISSSKPFEMEQLNLFASMVVRPEILAASCEASRDGGDACVIDESKQKCKPAHKLFKSASTVASSDTTFRHSHT